jgi:diguanylate cyclase (GGDEF)-like protein/PAS domain S-box-containing protein
MTAETLRIAYGVVLFLAVIVATWIVAVTWRWRRVPGSLPLMVQMVGEGFWTLCYALSLFSFIHPASEPFFWTKLMFLGVVMVPAGFLVWTSRYTRKDGWVNHWTIALLCIEPIAFNVIIWTDHWHHLFSGSYLTDGKLGIAFDLHTLYSYLLLLAGAVMLVINWWQLQPAYKKQGLWVLLGLVLSTVCNVMTILLLPVFKLDFSPMGFLIAGVTFTYAQLRHRLFDIMPVARHTIVDGMREGVVVLDNENRIIDMNPSAQKMMGLTIDQVIGRLATSTSPVWHDIDQKTAGQSDANVEIYLGEGAQRRHIDLTVTALTDRQGQIGGRLAIFRDITHLRKVEGDLRESNRELMRKIEEIEALQEQLRQQAIHDPLTGLYNRRFLEETLGRELAQAQRSGEPLSVAMIDIDRFKSINDTYGHGVGDLFLIALGDLLEQKTRAGDVACRFGGEEFIVVMPGAPLEVAAQRINDFRLSFNAVKIDVAGKTVSATFSAGVAGFPLHGMDEKVIISEADRALYAAKEAGRNRVIVALKEYV